MAAQQSAKNNVRELKQDNKSMLTKKQLLEIYEEMLYIRRFEEKAGAMYQQGLMGGFLHLYDGQEAVIAGCKAASKKGDEFITTYRCHAHAIACGLEGKEILAELCGRATGVSKGKGGSMHMFDPEKNFWGGHGIVGGNIPLGTGLAFTAKYRKTDDVTMTFFGDGAADQGAFFESMNMAAMWKLPVVYIIENNHYSMGTAQKRHSAGDYYTRGECFGIPGKKIDGMNFFEVYEGMKEVLEHARSGKGPYVVEMDTYRYKGHSMSDPGNYRSRDEVDCVKKDRDPINGLGEFLKQEHKVTEDDLKEINKRVKAQVAEDEKFAKESPEADLDEVYTDIFQPNDE